MDNQDVKIKKRGVGRPKKENIVVTPVRLEKEMYARLVDFSKQQGMSQSELIARALDYFIEQCEKSEHPMYRRS